MRHPEPSRLNDHVDGLLAEEEAAAVEEHLQACRRCRRRAEALERLASELAGLPREIAPRRDLRPGSGEVRRDGSAFARRGRWLRAAAVAALVTGGAAAAWLGLQPDGGPDAGPGDAVVAPYARATEALGVELSGRRDEMPPPAARALRVGLRSVDRAIRDLRTARERAPDRAEGDLTRRLESVYRTKLELLRTALSTLEET